MSVAAGVADGVGPVPGPAQNCATSIPTSRAAFATTPASARPINERSTRTVPPRGPRNVRCTPSVRRSVRRRVKPHTSS